jgi:hypothetical protein
LWLWWCSNAEQTFKLTNIACSQLALQHEHGGNGAVVEKVAVSCCVVFLLKSMGKKYQEEHGKCGGRGSSQKIIQGQKLLETKPSLLL